MFRGSDTPTKKGKTAKSTPILIESEGDDGDDDGVSILPPPRRTFRSPSSRRMVTRATPKKRRRVISSSSDSSQETPKKKVTTKQADGDNESSESGFGSLDENELVALAERVEASLPPVPAPASATVTTPTTPTPATPVGRTLASPRTPVTAFRNKLLIASESRSRSPAARQTAPAEEQHVAPLAPPPSRKSVQTPTRQDRFPASEPKRPLPAVTPTRPAPAPTSLPAAPKTRDALGTSKSKSFSDNLDFTPDIMKLLYNQPLTEPVRAAVRHQLELYSLRAKGVAAGRDMARSVAQAKDAKIKELEERLAALEKGQK